MRQLWEKNEKKSFIETTKKEEEEDKMEEGHAQLWLRRDPRTATQNPLSLGKVRVFSLDCDARLITVSDQEPSEGSPKNFLHLPKSL